MTQTNEVPIDPALRPRSWSEYIGQATLKTRLEMHINAAVAANRAMEHVLLCGPPGVGKTTMAKIIASRLGDPLLVISKPLPDREFQRTLIGSPGTAWEGVGCLFIDEAHRLGKAQMENLLPLLEDGYLDTPMGRVEFPFLTVIAATTERQSLIKPLLDRFMVKPTFADYSAEEMGLIVSGMAERAGLDLPHEDALELGQAAGGIPRHARELVVTYRDFVLNEGFRPLPDLVISMCERRADGLSDAQVQFLAYLEAAGGTAGMDSIADRLQIHPSEVRDLERLLIERSLIGRAPSGRYITHTGRARLAEDRPAPTLSHRRHVA